MIEEQGRVVAREPGAIWVETVRAGTCSSCQARQGCGHSVINRQAAGQRARLRVVTDLSFRDGDPVVIGTLGVADDDSDVQVWRHAFADGAEIWDCLLYTSDAADEL